MAFLKGYVELQLSLLAYLLPFVQVSAWRLEHHFSTLGILCTILKDRHIFELPHNGIQAVSKRCFPLLFQQRRNFIQGLVQNVIAILNNVRYTLSFSIFDTDTT